MVEEDVVLVVKIHELDVGLNSQEVLCLVLIFESIFSYLYDLVDPRGVNLEVREVHILSLN